MDLSTVKRAGKKIVNYPEHGIEVASSKDWLSRFWTNPFPHVRLPSLFGHFSQLISTRLSRLRHISSACFLSSVGSTDIVSIAFLRPPPSTYNDN